MAFDSWQAFWQMGGHGPYVWFAYSVTLLVMAGLIVAPIQRHRRLLRTIRTRGRRESGRGAVGSPNSVVR